jgi:hypothetical protein
MHPLDPHPAAWNEARLLTQCQVRRQKRSGPGGQHRNKVETAVVIEHIPSGQIGAASERRSQRENQRMALFRLRINLALAVRMPREPGIPPSPLWQSRVRSGRLSINPEHDDFPALLAEALDQLASHDFSPPAAAKNLSITATQLLKLISHEPRALSWVNQNRREQGQHELH